MTIVAFEMEDWEEEALRGLGVGRAVRFEAGTLTVETAASHSDAEIVSTFIDSAVTKAVLDALPRLKFIATRSTGTDHIDTAECAARGIQVANVPSYGKNTVAEHTFALLLALAHRLIEAVERTRQGRFSPIGLQGFDLGGKTMGVVGTGDIGCHVARIARGFQMPVLAFDVRPDPDLERELGLRFVDLDTLLAQSDVVTLHVPLTSHTRHLIGREQLAKMKDGAVLLNTARGEIVDIEALLEALHRGKLRGVGLDVLPLEPAIREEAELLRRAFEQRQDVSTLLADQLLLRMPNAIVTPHSAFNTKEAVQRILEVTVENIRAFLAGHPRNLV